MKDFYDDLSVKLQYFNLIWGYARLIMKNFYLPASVI